MPLITPSITLNLYLISEFAIIIFILFFEFDYFVVALTWKLALDVWSTPKHILFGDQEKGVVQCFFTIAS